MKKKLLIISVSIVILVCAIVLVFCFTNNSDDNKQEEITTATLVEELSVADKLFAAVNIEELQKIGKDNDITIEVYDEYKQAIAIGVDYFNFEGCNIVYNFDDNNNFEKCYIGFPMFDVLYSEEESVSGEEEHSMTEAFETEDISVEEVRYRCESIIRQFCSKYNKSVPDNICVFTFDGDVFRFNDEAGVSALANGDSVLKFAIRDDEGYFWELQVNSSGDYFGGEIAKYFDREATAGYYANISLSGTFGEPVELPDNTAEGNTLIEEASAEGNQEALTEEAEEITEEIITETEELTVIEIE